VLAAHGTPDTIMSAELQQMSEHRLGAAAHRTATRRSSALSRWERTGSTSGRRAKSPGPYWLTSASGLPIEQEQARGMTVRFRACRCWMFMQTG
jgi:hypothetical protein